MTGPWRTLVVDDAADVRCIVRLLLARDAGYELVGEAKDGAEGLAMIRELTPDLVLLDLAMPVMDGLEVLADLRADESDTTVVVLSGFASRPNAAVALAAGAVGYLEKRNLVDSLLPKLGSVLADRVRPGGA